MAVRCVEQTGGDPLPGTDIYALYPSDYDERELEAKFQSGNTSLEEICMEYGIHYRADDKGRTAVRRPMDRGAVLFARHQSKTTLAFDLDPNAEEWVLTLEPDFMAGVQVVDPLGNPAADVPVALRSRSDFYEFDLMSVRTNAQGFAEFKNLNVFLQDGVGPDGDMFLGLAILLPPEQKRLEIHEQPIRMGQPATKPIQLQLPEYGSVKVRLIGDQGQPVDMDGFAVLAPHRPDDSEERQMISNDIKVPIVGGEVHFRYVALQESLMLMAATKTGALGKQQVIAGPRRAGEVVEVEFVVANRCDVRGILHYADGTPAAKAKLDARYLTKSGTHSNQNRMRVVTDEDGGFQLSFSGEDLENPADSRRLLLVEHSIFGPSLSCSLDLPSTLPRGDLDLGQHTLKPMPLTVAGHVFDNAGQPLVGALVKLESKTTYDGSEHFYWSSVQGGQTRTQADGKFAIHAEVGDEELRVETEANGFMVQTDLVSKGDQEVEIRMQLGARMEGIVLLDPELPVKKMRVEVGIKQDDEEYAQYQHDSALVPVAGERGAYRYQLPDLETGVATLGLQGPQYQTILREENLPLQVGMDCTPLAWKRLDLRGRLKLVELRLFDSSGQSIRTEAEAYLNVGNSLDAKDGKFSLYLLDETPKVSIVAAGYRVTDLHGVSQSQDVILQDGINVRLHIPTDLNLGEGVTLRAQLFPELDNIVADESISGGWDIPAYATESSAEFGADGIADLRVPAGGSYWVNFILVVRKEDPPSSSTHRFGAGTRISVQEATGVQSFDLDIPRDRLDKVLERMR